ncbi:MAG: hypothetical protein ACI4KM_04785 [Oscillospiraceae bacterium]
MSEIRINNVPTTSIKRRTNSTTHVDFYSVAVPLGDGSNAYITLNESDVLLNINNGEPSLTMSTIIPGSEQAVRKASIYNPRTRAFETRYYSNAEIARLFNEQRQREEQQAMEEYYMNTPYYSEQSAFDYNDCDNYFYSNSDYEDDYFRRTRRLFSD